MAADSGCLTSGTPLGATANNTGTGGTATGTGITTTAANSWLLYETHCWGDGAMSNPTSPTMSVDFNSTIVGSWHLLEATAAPTGNVTQFNGNNAGNPWATRMVELLVATADVLMAQVVM